MYALSKGQFQLSQDQLVELFFLLASCNLVNTTVVLNTGFHPPIKAYLIEFSLRSFFEVKKHILSLKRSTFCNYGL